MYFEPFKRYKTWKFNISQYFYGHIIIRGKGLNTEHHFGSATLSSGIMKNLAAILRRGESSNQHTGRVHRLLAREEKDGRQEATATRRMAVSQPPPHSVQLMHKRGEEKEHNLATTRRREGSQRTTENYTPAPSPITFETR